MDKKGLICCGCIIKTALIIQLVVSAADGIPRKLRLARQAPLTSKVPPLPQIIGLELEPITLVEGEDSEILPCEVRNRGNAFLHWFKDGARIDLSNQSYQTVKMGLKIKNVKKEAAGLYVCQLSVGNDVIDKKKIPLTVDDAPPDIFSDTGAIRWVPSDEEFDKENETITISPREDVTFKCAVYGEPDIKAYWLINNEKQNGLDVESPYTKDKMRIKFPRRTGERSTNLLWKNSELADDGKVFTCFFTQMTSNGSLANISKSFILEVKEDSVIPPTIVNDNDKPLVAYIGENFTYNCRILKPEEQNRLVYFVWGRYYGVNKKDNSLNISDWKGGPILRLINVTEEDAGEYACYVTDRHLQDIRVFNLTVKSRFEKEDLRYNMYQENPNKTYMVIISTTVGSVVLVAITIIVVVVCMKKRKPVKHAKKRIILLAPTETYYDFMKDSSSDLAEPLMAPMVQIQGGRNRLSSEICSYSDYEFPLDEQWEIRPRNRVQMMHLLGEGAFGCVYYAELKPPLAEDSSTITPIAVKMLKADATDKELVDLVQELEVMKRFGKHKNIINLVGCMTRDGPLYVIVEYAQHGNLRDFLRNHRPVYTYGSRILSSPAYDDLQLTQKHLVTFAYQIANGMQYLATNQCLHRDLAARNVLVGEGYEMKIADFGLSRNLVQSDYYKKVTEGKLPIKWMAPEALIDRKYTTKSDVWSYGILLWEIFTLGGSPYPTVPHERLFEALREGHRMDKPTYSTIDVYALMRQCWQYHAVQRPTFGEIFDEIGEIIKRTNDDVLDIDCSPITTPRESTTSPRTSTTSFSCDEPHMPDLALPPELAPLPAGIMV